MKENIIDRLFRYVEFGDDVVNDCWIWKGSLIKGKHGRFSTREKKGQLAHRVSYAEFIGAIPAGKDVDHMCYMPRCINPNHLRPLDPILNRQLQPSAFKTHCVNGHEFSPENTYLITKRGGGRRSCRACGRVAVAKYERKLKAAMTPKESEARR